MKLIVLCFSALLICHVTVESAFEDYKNARWKQRILLIHAPDTSSALFKEFQIQRKAYPTEIRDRHLVTIHADAALQKRFHLPASHFTLLLIGKDGSAKARQTKEIDLKKLFALIDTMPMRQREMQRK